ncbi:ATP synthase protein I [Crenobacter luteus]|uniref:ATP synthase subunit I n=1 Tax=Crenobacter luteus TaxID=1452487 RepID=A0A165FKL7_9NEIS|nr:ATP synthase subunit I [Crenobacter luteus]KZE33565.1 ATP synthase subunit I [Crenobacter luteus]TCP12998.1 ATP synthase protein I [Crenobacter luteus]
MMSPEVKRVVRLQVAMTVAATVLVALFAGQDAALSALAGGAVVVIPALLYGRVSGAPGRAAPAVLMRAHYKAEAYKFLLTVVLMVVVGAFFKSLSIPALVLGYLSAASGYWFGLLIKN